MSQAELDRVGIIQKLNSKQITQVNAAAQLGMTTRHLRRLQRKHASKGAAGLTSKQRGKPSNNRLSKGIKSQAISLIQEHYYDFGPTLAHEKLIEQHGFNISVQSVRQLMIKEGIWKDKKRKKVYVHPMRERRPCYGELVQIDGSPHDWFEGRGPRCCLHVFIDDATSKLMQLHFAEQETTKAYFTAVESYLKQHGRPLSFYSDKHSIFRVNIKEAESGTGETQFSRAMRELGIELICAHSPQAKGRVERANSTLQDRLIKEMRLKSISDINTANQFLPKFIEDFNKRFAKEPSNPSNAHRSVSQDADRIKQIFSEQWQRKISKNLEISYRNKTYQIQSDTPSYTMRKAYLTVCERDDEITLLYKGKTLLYKVFDKNNKPTIVKDSKQIAEAKTTCPHQPAKNHPWRQYEKTTQRKIQQSSCA